MSDGPDIGVITRMFGMSHGLPVLFDVFVQDSPQALTQTR